MSASPTRSRPGDDRGERVVAEVDHNIRQERAFAQRLGRLAEERERNQDQADPGEGASRLPQLPGFGLEEEAGADDQEGRREDLEVEGEE